MFVGNDVQHMHHVFLKFVYTPKIETKNPKDSSSIIFWGVLCFVCDKNQDGQR